jgi:hypothetical protein
MAVRVGMSAADMAAAVTAAAMVLEGYLVTRHRTA